MIEAGFALLFGYLLGSVSGSLLLGRRLGVDVREHGSGNAGGTNALRVLGARIALLVVLIDVGKGALAVAVAWVIFPAEPDWPGAAAGLGAVVGHCFPLWHGFRGGKGWRAPPVRAFSCCRSGCRLWRRFGFSACSRAAS